MAKAIAYPSLEQGSAETLKKPKSPSVTYLLKAPSDFHTTHMKRKSYEDRILPWPHLPHLSSSLTCHTVSHLHILSHFKVFVFVLHLAGNTWLHESHIAHSSSSGLFSNITTLRSTSSPWRISLLYNNWQYITFFVVTLPILQCKFDEDRECVLYC